MSLLVIKVLVRFVAALSVAFVASVATFLLGLFVIPSIIPDNIGQFLEIPLAFAFFAITGFTGVFSGTFCLEQKSRRFGAIILLGIGLCYSICQLSSSDGGPDDGFLSLPYCFWPLMAGGTVAVLLFWFKPFKKRNRTLPAKPGTTAS